MNKKITFFTFAAVLMAFSFLFVSCPSGLEPSWKNADKPVFTLDFSTSFGDSGASRAIVQGGGFLYIRTIGGRTGTDGPLYGPFAVSAGSVFSTTDIPAGKYAGVAVIYALQKPNPNKTGSWNNKPYTFLEFMSLPDAEFLAAVDSGDKRVEFPMEDFFDSDASGNMVENVTLFPGRVNTVQITLEPFVRDSNMRRFTEVLSFSLSNSSSMKKQFFAIEDVPFGILSISRNAEPSAIVKEFNLYDFEGKRILLKTPSEEGTQESKQPIKNRRVYFYIESSGIIDLSFSVTPVPSSLTYLGGVEAKNKTFLFLLSEKVSQGDDKLVALGFINLDEYGCGNTIPIDRKAKPYVIEPNLEYSVMGFVDMNNRFPNLKYDLAFAIQNESFEPIDGDLIFDGSGSVTLTQKSQLVVKSDRFE